VSRQNSFGLKVAYSAGSLHTPTMIKTLRWLVILITAAIREHRELLKTLAPRQQMGVLKMRNRVSRLREDRLFWVLLCRIWSPIGSTPYTQFSR
jgi:hypothetical protein